MKEFVILLCEERPILEKEEKSLAVRIIGSSPARSCQFKYISDEKSILYEYLLKY